MSGTFCLRKVLKGGERNKEFIIYLRHFQNFRALLFKVKIHGLIFRYIDVSTQLNKLEEPSPNHPH